MSSAIVTQINKILLLFFKKPLIQTQTQTRKNKKMNFLNLFRFSSSQLQLEESEESKESEEPQSLQEHCSTMTVTGKCPKLVGLFHYAATQYWFTEEYMDDAWKEDPLLTLRCIFYIRDKEGIKNRQCGIYLFRWLHTKHRETASINMVWIPYYGRWDDFLIIKYDDESVMDFFANQLLRDKEALDTWYQSTDPKKSLQPPISMAAKWAPTEGHAGHENAVELRKALKLNNWKDYRQLLTYLRKALNIVERHMCARDWKAIDYTKVPRNAFEKYKKAFYRHDSQRVQAHMDALHPKLLNPDELIQKIRDNVVSGDAREELQQVQEMWTVWIEKVCASRVFERAVCMMDYGPTFSSGHIAIGLLIACCSRCSHDSILAYTDKPHWFSMGLTDRGKLRPLKTLIERTSGSWSGTINLETALDLILEKSLQNPESAPTSFYILSKQVQQEADSKYEQHLNNAVIKFESAGVKFPKIVFWNTTVDRDIMVFRHTHDIYVKGFTNRVMLDLLYGNTEVFDKTPTEDESIMRQVLLSDRYERLQLDPTDYPNTKEQEPQEWEYID